MSTPESKTTALDAPLGVFGFEFEDITPSKVSGRLTVTQKCCKGSSSPSEFHGGISAIMAEALASMGAHMANGFKRIAGVQLSIHHHGTAVLLGDVVSAEALPQHIGKTTQIWEVKVRKIDRSVEQNKPSEVISISRVIVMTDMDVPKNVNAAETLKHYAKL